MATLSQLKDALTALGVSTATGTLRGEARRDELARRLRQTRVASGEVGNREGEAGSTGLQHLSLAELRSALELRAISTQTPGLKGDARRHALIQRLMNSYRGLQSTKGGGSSCEDSVEPTSSRVGSSDGEADDTKSETSSSAYSTATDFFFYEAVDSRKNADPALQLEAKPLMPQLSFTRLQAKSEETEPTGELQRELFALRTKLHTARQEQQNEIQRVLREAGIEASLSEISAQLQSLERERRRLQENYFGHELVTSEILTPGSNQVQVEYIQEDALLLIEKRQEALKQLAERTKEAMAVAKFHVLQVEPAKMESARQEEEAVLKQIQQIELHLHAEVPQVSLPPSRTSLVSSEPSTPVLARCRSMPNGLQHDLWAQMDVKERRELHIELQTAASFHIRRDRVLLIAFESLDLSSPAIRAPSQADKLGMKARFMEKAKRNPSEIMQVYQKALELDNRHAENLGSYALFLCTTCAQMDQAENYFKKALGADPSNARNLANYANFLKCERQDFAESEARYKEALQKSPRDANILGGYADLLATKSHGSRDDLLSARRALKKALSILPAHIQNQLRLALVLADLKEGESAQRCFKQLIVAVEQQTTAQSGDQIRGCQSRKENDTLASIYEYYANFLCKCEQWTQAKQMYGKALTLDPHRPSLLRNFSCFLGESKPFLPPQSDAALR
ncbi:hypothetical protein PRNP1_011810 [Phytophthora ramorum]